ncbi:hypothetical protein ONS95_000862 [Cadophora gregata]|uniref:uncharacterized protein n=1 Tax=Cadophora gregata TaxID=51156 RepID=UPI0026DC17D7|nr:uncharacterized protein ONS95_000862 [Cadophora gregata]KAK0102942.1 hypothetical protein ONS96_005567 [Cadophora gregata f. sp. sojae]KAK0128918.1 hypothetical protein ONS95_000862 [Cadophora gregata]
MRLLPPLFAIAILLCTTISIPVVHNDVEKRTEVGEGCSYCKPGPWVTSAACNSYEYFAVASSMRNPPDDIKFDATSFCSEFLRPLITDLSIVEVTSATTTSTSVVISLVYASPETTKPSTPTKTSPPSSTATQTSSRPITTTSLTSIVSPANYLKKRNFTVPEYLEPWYFYGRLDPGCSCIITSADPSILISATETSTIYQYTVSTTVTEVYTIYPGMD